MSVRKSVVVNFLKNVRKTIEKGHCKGNLATDKYGNSISQKDDRACNFCLWGAMLRTEDRSRAKNPANILEKAEKFIEQSLHKGYDNYIAYNDAPTITKLHVLQLLDRAIKKAEQ